MRRLVESLLETAGTTKMKQLIISSSLLLICLAGCSMCCGPFDNDYPTFGGKHLRSDRSFGRVGSILSDPATILGGPGADSNLTPQPEPIAKTDDDDTTDIDLEDDGDLDLEPSGSGSRGSGSRDSGEMELEPIEPLKADPDVDDSTASRWRPRPLR